MKKTLGIAAAALIAGASLFAEGLSVNGFIRSGLINLLNLIPVDTIYLAGDICYRYELLAQRLQREIRAKALDRSRGNLKIYPSSQDPGVGLLAAADVVFSRFFTV